MLGNAKLNILRINCPFTRDSFSWASPLSPRKPDFPRPSLGRVTRCPIRGDMSGCAGLARCARSGSVRRRLVGVKRRPVGVKHRLGGRRRPVGRASSVAYVLLAGDGLEAEGFHGFGVALRLRLGLGLGLVSSYCSGTSAPAPHRGGSRPDPQATQARGVMPGGGTSAKAARVAAPSSMVLTVHSSLRTNPAPSPARR